MAVTVYGEETLGIEEGWPVSVMLLCVAAGVFCFIYFGIRYGMMNIDSYNHEAESERREREREAQGGDFYDRLTGLVCGIIMLIATVVGLWMLFTGGPIDGGGHERWLSGNGLFWAAWPPASSRYSDPSTTATADGSSTEPVYLRALFNG